MARYFGGRYEDLEKRVALLGPGGWRELPNGQRPWRTLYACLNFCISAGRLLFLAPMWLASLRFCCRLLLAYVCVCVWCVCGVCVCVCVCGVCVCVCVCVVCGVCVCVCVC